MVKKLKHGNFCEKKVAPEDLERAPVVAPKDPMYTCTGEAPKKNAKNGKKNRCAKQKMLDFLCISGMFCGHMFLSIYVVWVLF